MFCAETETRDAPSEPPPAPAMAFTIDFSSGDAKMGDKDGLNKFPPSKARKNFRSRSIKGQKSHDEDADRQVRDDEMPFESQKNS